MKTETKEIYKCDFCRRLYQIKGAAIKHEIRCGKNPANHTACFGCANLTKKTIDIYSDRWDGGEIVRDVSVFFCKVKQICMHHPISRHKKTVFDLGDFENEQMPIECEQRESEWDAVDFLTANMV